MLKIETKARGKIFQMVIKEIYIYNFNLFQMSKIRCGELFTGRWNITHVYWGPHSRGRFINSIKSTSI